MNSTSENPTTAAEEAEDGNNDVRTFNIAPSSLVLCLILSLLIATSIVGNILVCIAVATDKHLRKLSNLFLVSLAVADLLVAAVVMPVALLNDLALETWPFGMTFCKVWIASDVMCSTASIINLCAISLDRYVHIKDPLQYTEWITRRTVPISIAVIWILSALMSFLPISLNLHMASGSVPENDSCTVDFNPSYSIISSVISFFVPCFIMLFIYFHVYSFARYHMECIKEQSKPLLRLRKISQNAANGGNGGAAANGQSNDESQDGIIAENDLQHHHNVSNGTTAKAKTSFKERTASLRRKPRKKSKLLPDPSASPLYQEHKAAITIGIIMGIFLLCWTPFFIVNIISGLCKNCVSPTLFQVLTWLGYSNSAFNPIIYSIFNTEFREAFHRILTQRPLCCRKDSLDGSYPPIFV